MDYVCHLSIFNTTTKQGKTNHRDWRVFMGHRMSVTLLSCMVLAGCGEKAKEIPEPESRPVKLLSVSIGDNQSFRTFPATVAAGDKAVLAFRVPGQLQHVFAHPGDVVKRGQKLAQLNVDELSLQVRQAQANYQLEKVQFDRNAQLRKTNVVSELDFDASKSALKQAKATLDKAKANLAYATLKAPYNGNVSLSLIENYEYVGAKQPVMHIQSAGLINVTFQLPDHLLTRFQSTTDDIKPVVTFDTIKGQTYQAKFKEIDTESDPKTSSYKVTLYMERPEGKNILPGMSGQVRLAIPKGESGSVPKRALMTEGNEVYVWHVDEQGLAHKVKVQLDEQQHIVSGLNDGDQIATSGVKELQEGQKVRPWIKERGL